MRKIHIFIILVLLIVLQSCNTKENLIEGSDIDTSTPFLNPTDSWLRDNYTTPYNIEVLYNWNNSRVDYNRYLYPPTLEKILPAMEAIKTIWLDTYNEVAGSNFVKKIAPREIFNGRWY